MIENVDEDECFCYREPKTLWNNDHASPKGPTESKEGNPPIARLCGVIQHARLIRAEPAKSPIREIDPFQLLLGFVLKPDVIRESIWVPYFRLITIRLFYLGKRRPPFNLKDPTIVLVVAERD